MGAVLGIASLGMGLYGISEQRRAGKQQAEYARKAAESSAVALEASADEEELQKWVMGENLKVARWRASDAIERSLKASAEIQISARGFKGTQRAQQAASGLKVNTGTFKAMIDDTVRGAAKDVETQMKSGRREAYEHRLDAFGIKQSIKLADMSISSKRRAAKRARETGVAHAAQISSATRANTIGQLAGLAGQAYDMFRKPAVFNPAQQGVQQYAPMHRPGFGA